MRLSRRPHSLLWSFPLLVLGLLVGAAPLLAQQTAGSPPAQQGEVKPLGICNPDVDPKCAGDTDPPVVTISPATGARTSATVAVTITWYDNKSLTGSSRSITLNGGSVTGSFSYTTSGVNYATSTGTITLQPGTNILTASIKDAALNTGSSTVTYTYTVPRPTVAVTPDGGTDRPPPNASGWIKRFTVASTSGPSEGAKYNLSAQCTGTASGCSVSPATVTLTSGTSADVQVSYSTGADGSTGRVQLTATYAYDATVQDMGWVDVSAEARCDGNIATVLPCNVGPVATLTTTASGVPYTFTLTNRGTAQELFQLSCTATAPVTGCSAPSRADVAPGATANVTVSITTGSSEGVGRIRLKAKDGPEEVATTVDIEVLAATSVAVTTATPTVRVEAGASATHSFTVRNAGSLRATYALTPVCTGAVLFCPGSLAPVTLNPGATANVSVAYQGGAAGGSGTVGLRASHTGNAAITSTASASVTVNSYGVTVTPDGAAASMAGRSTSTYGFTVRNLGNTAMMYRMAPSCTSTVFTRCTIPRDTLTLAPSGATGDAATVDVTYESGAGGASGTVQLVATASSRSGVQDAGWITVAVARSYPSVASANTALASGYLIASPDYDFSVTEYRPGEGWPQIGTTTGRRVTVATGGTVSFTVGASDAVGLTLMTWDVYDPSGAFVTGYRTPVSGTTATASISHPLGRAGAWRVHAHVTNADGNVRAVIFTVDAQDLVTVANSDGLIERDLCLTVAVGARAAYECGDLRVAHPLPAIRTMNVERSPTLLYNSQHAQPSPLLVSQITLPLNESLPDTVKAIVNFRGADRDTVSIPGSAWNLGETRRVALRLNKADAAPDPTGFYSYRLTVTRSYNVPQTRHSEETTGTIIVVDRSSSPFGAGWWLAGLEQLKLDSLPNAILWVGGDGSARVYRSVQNQQGVWAAAAVNRPDTLKQVGSGYVRYLPHRAEIRFNAQGQHVASVNRLQQVTAFSYTGGLLTRIGLPPDTIAYRYDFTYTAGKLDSIAAPGHNSRPGVKATITGGRLMALRDPKLSLADTSLTRFTYTAGTHRLTARINKRGDTTAFAYDPKVRQLSSARIAMGADTLDVVHRFRAADSLALPASGAPQAIPLDSAYVRLDGPRSGADYTQFWLTDLGAPAKIRDALGHETILTRGDKRWPGLVTRLQNANGRVVEATYDDHGNILAETDRSRSRTACAGGNCTTQLATTRYEWNTDYDFVTKITQPEGEVTRFDYDPATGNRLYVQVGPDVKRRTTFAYGNGFGFLSSIVRPDSIVVRDSVEYDERGNLAATRTPLGYWTSFYKDSLGRDTLVVSPIDSADKGRGAPHTQRLQERFIYDAWSRLTQTATSGPRVTFGFNKSAFTSDAPTATVVTHYDLEDNVTAVERSASPDINNIGTITTRTFYDKASRPILEVAVDGEKDSLVYDQAGNLIETHTRRGHVLRMRYDLLNRLEEREVQSVSYKDTLTTPDGWRFPRLPNCNTSWYCIPADVQHYTYDAVGNMLTAVNQYAEIGRGYNLDGTIAVDTLRIRTWTPVDSGGNFASHVYVLRMGYDLNGRRTKLIHPSQMAPTFAGQTTPQDSSAYTYDPETGELQTVRDVLGNTFRFVYDRQLRLDSLWFPGRSFEKRYYDADGRIRRREEQALNFIGQFNGRPTPYLRLEDMQYDARGRLLYVGDQYGVQASDSNVYSALGSLLRSKHVYRDSLWVNGIGSVAIAAYVDERRDVDALARNNLLQTRYWWSNSTPLVTDYYTSGTERTWSHQGDRDGDWEFTRYDKAGNVNFLRREPEGGRSERYKSASYYRADNVLAAVDMRNNWTNDSTYHTFFEEYRYDALGRRILRRSRPDHACATKNCISAVQRFIWDGSQILYETNWPGYGDSYLEIDVGTAELQKHWGRVAYTHGPGVDRPLDIIRMGYSDGYIDGQVQPELRIIDYSPLVLVPHWNWRGDPDLGTFDDGASQRCEHGKCVLIDYVYATKPFSYNLKPWPRSWFGSLLTQQQDAVGLQYKRNRYYDPASGKFTQEDPIGLAGGLNAYAFAHGDPVNYSDPFGLCPDPNKPWCTSPLYYTLRFFGASDATADKAAEIGYAGATSAGAPGIGMAVRGMAGAMARAGAVSVPGPRDTPYGKTDFLLGNVRGSKKSADRGGFFRGVLGFDEGTMEPALKKHFYQNAGGGSINAQGFLDVVGPMTGPNGRTATVLTSWQRGANGVWQFITAFPR